MFDISRNVLRKITTELPQQPLLSPRTEQLISMPTEEVPLLQKKTEEELLPKTSQREFLPLKGISEKIKTLEEGQQLVPSAPLEEKPLLFEPEQIQEGQLIPQSETGSGIPVGGGTQRRRRISDISRKRVLERLRKRGAKAISKSSRLVGRTIRRKPKRKRKFGRRKVKKQIRCRTTTRRRTRR